MNNNPITQLKSFRSGFVLTITILITAIIFFEGGAVSVALPHIQKEFGANLSQIQWIPNSYALVLAVFILTSGRLGDIFGRKKIILIGLALFGIGGFFVGEANSIPHMILFRVMQGLGGAILIPQSLAVINSEFTPKIRGMAIGLWTASTSFLLIFGAYLAGLMIESWGWRSVFDSILPLSVLVALMTWYSLKPDSAIKTRINLDWLGILTLGIGLFGIFFALIQIPVLGWQNWQIWLSFAAGIAFVFIFLRVEKISKQPLINFSIISKKNIFGANLFTFLMYIVSNGLIFFISIFMQQVLEFSASNAGLGILPMILPIVLVSIFSGRLADKLNEKWLLFGGAIIVAVGFLWMSWQVTELDYWFGVAPGLVLIGIGFGIFVPSLTKLALDVEPEYSGLASGINNSTSTIAGLLGVAVLSLLVSGLFNYNIRQQIQLTNYNQFQQTEILDFTEKLVETPAPKSFTEQQLMQFQDIKKISFSRAFSIQLLVSASVCVVAAAATLTIRKRNIQP